MTELVDLSVLEPSANEGYLNWPLPTERDREIRTLLELLLRSNANRSGLTHEHARVLVAFAERMASLSRHNDGVDHLRSGLLAAGLAAETEDTQIVLLVLPLLWRSAEVLGLDPEEQFRIAVAHVGDGQLLLSFLDRTPENRNISVMGYKEIEDEFGFFYERTW